MPVVPFSTTGTGTTTIASAVSGQKNKLLGLVLTSVGTAGKIIQLKAGARVIATFAAGGGAVNISPADQFDWDSLIFQNEALTLVADDAATTYSGFAQYVQRPSDVSYATPIGMLLILTRVS